MSYDLIIKNGMIVDGSGGARYRGDVGVKDGKIARIGKLDGEDHGRDARRRRSCRDTGLCRRPHPYGRSSLLGSARQLLTAITASPRR